MINWFSIIGLLLDIIGVILLFFFGLPSRHINKTNFLSIGVVYGEEKIKIDRKNRLIKIFAIIGLMCIFIGFILQLIGTIHVS